MVGVPVKDQDLLDALGLGAAGTHGNLGGETGSRLGERLTLLTRQ